MLSFYEFFAGGGMVREALGADWQCLFANDIDLKKARAYADNHGSEELVIADVASITTQQLPGTPDLVWASFPCQDLSLAGNGAGLAGVRSGTFWPFWHLVKALSSQDRKPAIVALENVYGLLTSHSGSDFRALCDAVAAEGYYVGALVMNAVHFVPQSRPRLFVVAIDQRLDVSAFASITPPNSMFVPPKLIEAAGLLSGKAATAWRWWNIPAPSVRSIGLADLIEDEPLGVDWHTPGQTARLLDLMNPRHRKKVEDAKVSKTRKIGTIYKRTRVGPDRVRSQQAEVRFDDIAGCLRTPGGGSSRQTVLVVEGGTVRSRLLSPRETARLMGLPDSFRLPERYNDAYHFTGDGVVVPVVRHLAYSLFGPVLEARRDREEAA